MNIWWVKSRSTKKNKKNTTQAYLRWYENRKPITKKLDGMVKFTGRLTPQQSKWNKKVDLDVAMDSIDVEKLTIAERLKLIQIGLQYVIPRLKQVDNVEDEMPREFQIEIIDSLSKYSNDELDKAIKG